MEADTVRMHGDPLITSPNAVPLHDIEALYRAHAARLVKLAAAIIFDRDGAQEVVHDAFAGLQRRNTAVVDAEAYLQRSVVNLSLKVLRRRTLRGRYRPDPPLVTDLPEIDETLAAVLRLPVRQRAVVALRFWEDLSEAETAKMLGWPAGTVKSTLHRALARLRKEMQP